MKKLLFPILVILVMTAGCMPGAPVPVSPPAKNQPPTAYIDSISPTEASLGEMVTFNGHGTDPDGTVVAYRWRSSLDGELGTLASFDTSSLSAGNHTVYLKVQDNNGDWSEEVRSAVTVSGGIVGAPVVNSFDANPGSISLGASSTLSWNVSGATTVSIDQGIGNVALTGTRVVSPSTTMVYTLTATNVGGSVTATAQVVVTGAPSGGLPVINSFIANPGSITAGNSSTLSWNVSNATSVDISPGVGSVPSVGSILVLPGTTTNYTLTATNAAGWRSLTIMVVVSGAPPFAVTSVTASVSPSGYTGPCPKDFSCSAVITVNGPGTVTYRWERTDGPSSTQTIAFAGAGSKTVTTGWPRDASGNYFVRVRTLTPNEVASYRIFFSVTCE